jgi:large subunit ribosomal protein L21
MPPEEGCAGLCRVHRHEGCVCGPPSDAVEACIRPTAKLKFEQFKRCVLRGVGGFVMYAVIRTGGKQYRVAPGDVVKIESVGSKDQTIEFSDVLAISGEPGTIAKPSSAKVTAEILGEGRGDKILVFHLKRKKQYKKLQGHRQGFTEVRIKAIEADGVTYTAAS